MISVLRDPAEIVMLAAGENRRRNFVDLGCRKDKHDMGGRLFQCFEQRIEGRIRQHVDFVDDVDAVLPTKRGELDVLSDLAHIVHARIRRAVDLHDIDGMSLAQFPRQLAQMPQGMPVGPCSQLSALARIRATVVFPTPRVPEKRYAWAIRFVVIELTSVWTTWGWPITSSNVPGRYFLAETW